MPLTDKGQTIKANFEKEYGHANGDRYFFAAANKGTIAGIDAAKLDEVVSKVNALAARADAAWADKTSAQYEAALEAYVKSINEHYARGLTKTAEQLTRELTAHGNAAKPFLARIKKDSDARNDSTDRREVEALAKKMKATLNYDKEQRIESVTVDGRTMSPLSFAEWARARKDDDARQDWNAFPSMHIDQLKRILAEGVWQGAPNPDMMAKIQKEISERESGKSTNRAVPQIAPGWVNGMPPRGGQR